MSLKALPASGDGVQLHNANVPWQRVINSKGVISPRYVVRHISLLIISTRINDCLIIVCRGVNGASNQAEALRAEGVEVDRGSLGEYTVDFQQYGWFPDSLTHL